MNPPPAPLPNWLGSLLRPPLRAWSRSGFRPGHAYSIVERHGRRLARGPLSAKLVDGSRITCLLDEHIQRQIYFFGTYEPIEAYLFRVLCRPGMTVVDLGANIGQYTLLAARRVGPGGQVHAFEPVPANAVRVAAHVTENGFDGRVTLNRAAAWSHRTTLDLYLDRQDADDNKTDYTVGVREDPADLLRVEALPLDEYVRGSGARRIGLIKLDIEGAELFALRGMTRVLAESRPDLLLEINRPNCRSAGYEPEAIEELLRGHGYHFWEIGISPAASGPRPGFAGIERANVICHTGALPPAVTSGWSYKKILRGLTPPTSPADSPS